MVSPNQSVMRPDCSTPPKSAWHTHLKEHKGAPSSITMRPRDGSVILACHPSEYGMWWQILDHFYIVVAIQKSCAHKS